MPKFLRLCNQHTMCMRYIPTKRDIRHVIYRWEAPCLSEASKALIKQLQGFAKALAFPKGYRVAYPS